MSWFTKLANSIRFAAPSRKRPRGRRPHTKSLTVESLESRQLLTALVMTPYEQLLTELVNRARMDPEGEAARYGIDLNQGLAPGTISSDPKQPLAPNQILIDVTGAHSDDMLDNDYFSHTDLDGHSPSERAMAAGYPVGVAENISLGGSTGPIDFEQHVYDRHEHLFLSSGHRQNIMNPVRQEFGTGVRFGQYTTGGTTYNASMVTENFGNPPGDNFLTGIVFTDASDNSPDDDDFYTIGEEVGSGTITAINVGTGQNYTTTLGPTGGWALQIPSGTYDVTAGGGALAETYIVENVVLGIENVKVDFETTTATVAPPANDVNVFVVNSTLDTADANPGDGVADDGSGNTTLRAAIEEANALANLPAGPDEILFNIPGSGIHTIQPQSPFPNLTRPVVIDATSQPGYVDSPVIQIDGSAAGAGASGLTISGSGDGSTIRGLAVNRFDAHGIYVSRRDNVRIEANYIGTNPSGAIDRGNGGAGVRVLNGDNNTIVGNLISGNDTGVTIEGSTSTGNIVTGNLIGTDATGTFVLGNVAAGVEIGSPGNMVGGATQADRNLISGNASGVTLVTANATGNVIQGNYIGTDVTGTQPLANQYGVEIVDAGGNTTGGAAAGAGNLISGNTKAGLRSLRGDNNLVQGNLIGTDESSAGAVANRRGVELQDADGNQIGGTAAAERNIISGNIKSGVFIKGTSAGTDVEGNYIGTDDTGMLAVPNLHGVRIGQNATNNTVGGTATGAGNLISGNAANGVWLNADGNFVQGNLIGTDATGAAALGNHDGFDIRRASNNVIGGSATGAGNVISGNVQSGIRIGHSTTTNNLVQGNRIGTSLDGSAAVANLNGVVIDKAPSNTIGGAAAGEGNVISGNTNNGVIIQGSTAENNRLEGNIIGADANQTSAVANGVGVVVIDAPNNFIGGLAAGAGNVIGGNGTIGIKISGPAATGNRVLGNLVGLGNSGQPLPNLDGIRILDGAADNEIGGTAAGAGNTFAFNTGRGVRVIDGNGNSILHNLFHDNAGLGIDLNPLGPTPNDPDDADTGPNRLQNSPEIVTATLDAGTLNIVYSIPTTVVNSTFPITVEFFLADTDGEEGQTLLGSHSYLAPGPATALGIPSGGASDGALIVATATDDDGNTSEFSLAAAVAG